MINLGPNLLLYLYLYWRFWRKWCLNISPLCVNPGNCSPSAHWHFCVCLLLFRLPNLIDFTLRVQKLAIASQESQCLFLTLFLRMASSTLKYFLEHRSHFIPSSGQIGTTALPFFRVQQQATVGLWLSSFSGITTLHCQLSNIKHLV